MSDDRLSKEGSKRAGDFHSLRRRGRVVSFVAVAFAPFCSFVMILVGGLATAGTNEEPSKRLPISAEASVLTPAQNYARFSHSYPGAHAALTGRWSCSICHDRRDNSIEPEFPVHRDCIACHQTQFTTPDSPMCSICHTPEGLAQQNPPLKQFSRSLSGFRTDFDHQQHSAGESRPAENCAACHAPARRGVAKTIPAGLIAHQTCYQCHTAGRQSGGVDISSCGACHAPGRYAPTSTAARAFRVGFSHADHGPRQRLGCEGCHIVGRRGLPQGRQVSSTFPQQHFPTTRAQTCITCHNGQRSFGETNFNDCRRCHTGPTFRL